MKVSEILGKLDSLKCHVGPNGLYLVDDFLTMLVTDWKVSRIWSQIGMEVIKRQSPEEGIDLTAILQGESGGQLEFPSLDELDDKIRSCYHENRKNLMEQYRNEEVCIKLAAEGDFFIFNDDGDELYVMDNHVYLLAALGAKLLSSKDHEEMVAFSADPGIVGFVYRCELESPASEAANEDIEECRKILGEFESFYIMKRRSPEFHRSHGQIMGEIRAELADTLSRISGYEHHMDISFNSQVEELVQEVFPQVTISRGIHFPVLGPEELFETAHPERFQFIETDGRRWYAFVADWDKGYSDGLGTYLPIKPQVAEYLKRKIPTLKVRRTGG